MRQQDDAPDQERQTPAPRRSRAKKPGTEPTGAAPDPAGEESRPRRRTAAKASGTGEEETRERPASSRKTGAAGAEANDDEAQATPRRRTRRAASAPPEGAAEKSPAPRRRTARPAATGETVEEEAASEAEPATPRTTRAKTGTATRKPSSARGRAAPSGSGKGSRRGTRTKAKPPPPPLGSRLRVLVWRPAAALLVALLITIGLGYSTTRLNTDASASLLMDTGSATYEAQVRFADLFGADPVVVAVEPEKGQKLLTANHLVGLAQLEGQLSRKPGVHKVYGPGTLVNTFAAEVTKRALQLCGEEGTAAEKKAEAQAKAAGKSSSDQSQAGQAAFNSAVQACAQQLAQAYPDLSSPFLNNPAFFDELLLQPNGKVRPYWRSVLPTTDRALVTARLDPNASLGDVQAVEREVANATTGARSKSVKASNGQKVQAATLAGNLQGLHFEVSGTPVLMAELAQDAVDSLRVLLPLALIVMVLLTLFVLRVRFRLVAVPVAILAVVWTAGAAALCRIPLTPATLAVLPVVLGLSTDYVLQTANRLAEEEGEPGPRVRSSMRAILPATGLAAAATAAGVLAFAVSTIPLIRQFGFFLAMGVAMSWLAALLVGLPALRILAGRFPKSRPPPSWNLLAQAARIPKLALIPLVLIGLAGWAALPVQRVQTDPARLLPAGSPALSEAHAVYRAVGESGEVDVVVTGSNVTSPRVVAWMGTVEQKLNGHGLRSVSGLPDFLLAFNYGKAPDQSTTNTFLSRLPPYFTRAVVSTDHHTALITFAQTSVTSVTQDQALIARIDRATAHPPKGYHAYPAGLAVIAAQALSRLSQEQVLLNVLALALVLVILLAVMRRPLPAVLAILPTAVAAGWATGIAWIIHAQMTPVTVLLSGVVVAFATEFGVLWLSRYRAELRSGGEAEAAAEIACRRIGPAIVAAALALIAAFAALAVSPVPMIRSFGLWSAGDLALAAVAVLVLLPPVARSWLRRA